MSETRSSAPTVPVCPVDQLRMTETIVGWRCPLCGTAAAHG